MGMEDNVKEAVEAPAVAIARPRTDRLSSDRPSRRLKYDVIAGEFALGKLLKSMKAASGLTTRQIATQMGIEKESLDQYFWSKVAKGGTGRLSWFLRFAEATGCQIWITFPSLREQHLLKLKVTGSEDSEA